MADIFKDIVPSILQTKQNVLENEKDYVPYLVNKALSYHYDCIMQANEMNMCPFLDKRLQYDYLLNTIRSRKRPFQKWHKKEILENFSLVKEYFYYSDEKTNEALSVLSDADIEKIRNLMNKGGFENDRLNRFHRNNPSRTG